MSDSKDVRRVELRSPAEVERLLESLGVSDDLLLNNMVRTYWETVGELWQAHDFVCERVRELHARNDLSEYRAERVTGWARSTVRGVLGKPKKGVV